MEKIIGLIDAPFTPFYANGDVNLEPIEAYAKMLQKNGLNGVFINGSSGEGYMLTTEERMQLAERWVSVAPEGFKVIVHVGSCCLRESVRLAEHAQKIGAWGIGSMAPPFPKIGRIEELVEYCETIANAAPNLPFYYYHIPAFNGAFLPMLDLLKAVDGRIANFAGIKYTYESLHRATSGPALRRRYDPDKAAAPAGEEARRPVPACPLEERQAPHHHARALHHGTAAAAPQAADRLAASGR